MSAITVSTTGSPISARELVRIKTRLDEIRSIIARMEPDERRLVQALLLEKPEPAPVDAPEVERGPEYRKFGAFAGLFSVGPEFYEPLSEEELRAWGEV